MASLDEKYPKLFLLHRNLSKCLWEIENGKFDDNKGLRLSKFIFKDLHTELENILKEAAHKEGVEVS